jgi:hypothetical protein
MSDHDDYHLEVPDDLSSLYATPSVARMEFDDETPLFLSVAGIGLTEVLAMQVISHIFKHNKESLKMMGENTRVVMDTTVTTIDLKGDQAERSVIVSFVVGDPKRTWSVSYGASADCSCGLCDNE